MYLRTKLSMKRFLAAQLQPVKTMRQFIADRSTYRVLILTTLGMMWCF
jgi:hypothetical protein